MSIITKYLTYFYIDKNQSSSMRNFNYKNQNSWQPMINIDELFRGHKVSLVLAAVWGWVYNLYLLDIRTFSWEFVIKGLSGLVFAAASTFIVVVTKDFYRIKVKNKIFKNGKETNQTENNEEGEEVA